MAVGPIGQTVDQHELPPIWLHRLHLCVRYLQNRKQEAELGWQGPKARASASAALPSLPTICEALNKPGRTEGVRKIAERFGVNAGTVQRISRPFDGASVALA